MPRYSTRSSRSIHTAMLGREEIGVISRKGKSSTLQQVSSYLLGPLLGSCSPIVGINVASGDYQKRLFQNMEINGWIFCVNDHVGV
jgi:hypothetical protein